MGLLVIRIVKPRVDPDKKILRYLQDASYRDEADTYNHCGRGKDMHTRYIASEPLTDSTRIELTCRSRNTQK